MHPCESTLGYINLAPFDLDEEHSSQSPPHGRGVVGCIINFAGFDSEGEHPPMEEVEGMGEEDLENHRVVEESVASAWSEEEEVHPAVEESFESLREDRVRALLRAKNKGMKASASWRFPSAGLTTRSARFGCPLWLGARPREAWAVAPMLGCTNHFVGEGATLDVANTLSSSSSGSDRGQNIIKGRLL
jgi:hypothetical protein